jgi:hypothetical protein
MRVEHNSTSDTFLCKCQCSESVYRKEMLCVLVHTVTCLLNTGYLLKILILSLEKLKKQVFIAFWTGVEIEFLQLMSRNALLQQDIEAY